MPKVIVILAGIGTFALATPCSAAVADTPLQFVREYIYEISSIENIRATSEKEQAAEPDSTHVMLTCIRTTEAWNLELSGDINIMNGKHLDTGSQADEAPQDVAKLFTQKREIVSALASICSTMAKGPRDGVDYGEIMANMPKITAQLDYIDKLIFQTSPLVFMTLISNRPDSRNHMSHLVITKAERVALIDTIVASFGDRLDKPDQKYAVAIGQIFKDKLNEFHAFDDPW